MFSEFNIELDEDRVVTTTAVVLSIAQHISKDALKGGLEQLTFQTTNGNVVIKAISENAIITLFTDKDADLNYISNRLNSTIKILKESTRTL